MTRAPSSESEWTIHAINIHGLFFERWCQQVVSDSAGWRMVASNYPVEFPPPNGSIRGRESSLDIRADRDFGNSRVSLSIECKKNNPDLVNWIFFPKPAPSGNWFNVSVNTFRQNDPPATGWEVEAGIETLTLTATLADDARETRGDYLLAKGGNKTKTSNAAINEAAFQVALAKQALVAESVAFEKALSKAATTARTGANRQLFVPIIVTTANLFTCTFDPSDVDPQTGEMPIGSGSLVPCSRVVYEYGIPKQLQHSPADLPATLAAGWIDAFTRMHILVVHSSDFATFLSTMFG